MRLSLIGNVSLVQSQAQAKMALVPVTFPVTEV